MSIAQKAHESSTTMAQKAHERGTKSAQQWHDKKRSGSVQRKNILLTGGRAPVTLDLARKFAYEGHRVFIAESIPVYLCRYSTCVQKTYTVPSPRIEPDAFIDALLDIMQLEQIDLLIPTCEEIFYIAQSLARLQASCTVFTTPIEQMRRLHSKWDFIQRARSYGLTVPETHLFTTLCELKRYLATLEHPVVLKPVFSRFATKVLMLDSIKQAQAITISEEYPWVAQERIEGQAFCSYSIVHAGRLAAHAVYPVNFTAGRGACIDFAAIEHQAIDAWVRRFLAAEQFTGQIAFDFIVTRTGNVYPLECNPRATSGVHLFQDGDHLPLAFFAEDAQEQILRPRQNAQAMLGLAMPLYGLSSVHSLTRLVQWGQTMLHARDVIFRLNDLGPFLAQPLLAWYNWRSSRAAHLSITEFSTRDIEWNGDLLTHQPKELLS